MSPGCIRIYVLIQIELKLCKIIAHEHAAAHTGIDHDSLRMESEHPLSIII